MEERGSSAACLVGQPAARPMTNGPMIICFVLSPLPNSVIPLFIKDPGTFFFYRGLLQNGIPLQRDKTY